MHSRIVIKPFQCRRRADKLLKRCALLQLRLNTPKQRCGLQLPVSQRLHRLHSLLRTRDGSACNSQQAVSALNGGIAVLKLVAVTELCIGNGSGRSTLNGSIKDCLHHGRAATACSGLMMGAVEVATEVTEEMSLASLCVDT
jgi:hypothetical protein